MGPSEIEALFTRRDGQYLFARWGRPVVPVVFGVEDASLAVFKGAIEAVVALAGHRMAVTDPELGANLMVFCFREWGELLEVRDLGRLVPELEGLVARLEGAEANQYRLFRFDVEGAIKAAFVFLRMDAALAEMPAETLALAQAVQVILLWSTQAFDGTSPLAQVGDLVGEQVLIDLRFEQLVGVSSHLDEGLQGGMGGQLVLLLFFDDPVD